MKRLVDARGEGGGSTTSPIFDRREAPPLPTRRPGEQESRPVSSRESILKVGFRGGSGTDGLRSEQDFRLSDRGGGQKWRFSQASNRSFQPEAWGAFPGLEVQFHRALQNARRCGADRASERGTADVPVHRAGPIKLGVIEDVEAFYAEQQRL
jgi:hypothetical protein